MFQAFNLTAYHYYIFVISIRGVVNLNYCLETLTLGKTFDVWISTRFALCGSNCESCVETELKTENNMKQIKEKTD